MPNKKTQQLEILLGNVDRIVSLLSLETFPEEDQMRVIDRFADILLKRILLRIPPENIEEAKQALLAEDGDLERFADILKRVIPESDKCLQEEFEKTILDFKQKQ